MEEAKDIIFKDLKNKKGIYLLYNNLDDSFYIGSGINLYKRLSTSPKRRGTSASQKYLLLSISFSR
jgi:predicted GIY-YIG superfamily endonuclease